MFLHFLEKTGIKKTKQIESEGPEKSIIHFLRLQ